MNNPILVFTEPSKHLGWMVPALLMLALFHSAPAYGDLSRQCVYELQKFCGNSQNQEEQTTCLRKHNNELSQDCRTYSGRLNSAINISGDFQTVCAAEYATTCGGGMFKVARARSCLGKNKSRLSEICRNSYNKYFAGLKKISHSTEEAIVNNTVEPANYEKLVPNSAAETTGAVVFASTKVKDAKSAVQAAHSKYADPKALAAAKLADTKSSLLKRGKDKAGDMAKAALARFGGGAGDGIASKFAKLGGGDAEKGKEDAAAEGGGDLKDEAKKKAKSVLGGFLD